MPAKKSLPTDTESLSLAVGERIVRLREIHELAPHQLAELAGMDVNYLWRIEAGRQNLSLRNVARLAKAFNVSLSELLQGVDVASVELGSRTYVRRLGRQASADG